MPIIRGYEFTINSGAEVPKATIVKPIAKSEILYCLARAEAPLTNQLAPKISATNPVIINAKDIIIFNQL